MATYPQFGAQNGFTRTSASDRSDQAELQMGRHSEVFVKSTTQECVAGKSDCSWGIEPAKLGSADLYLDSVKISIEDEMDPRYTAAQTSGTIDPDKPLVKLLSGCCIVRRAKVTMSINGKGNPGVTPGPAAYPTPLKVAIGTLDVGGVLSSDVPTAIVRITNVTVNDTEQDWETFTIDYTGYADADTTGASIAHTLVTAAGVMPVSCACGDGSGTCCDTYKMEYTLNGTGYAEKAGTQIRHQFAS